jgi:alkylation response protein AidB-like acyl-CoA dehydrogenase
LRERDVSYALYQTRVAMRVNELLNWQVATAEQVEMADASATKIFSSERLQHLGELLETAVARHGGPPELVRWLDIQTKRNLVLTFGGGVNEIQRELIATAGLGLPRVPR